MEDTEAIIKLRSDVTIELQQMLETARSYFAKNKREDGEKKDTDKWLPGVKTDANAKLAESRTQIRPRSKSVLRSIAVSLFV